MKKGLAISLAILMALVLTSAVWAVDFTVNFAAGDPDVTLTCYRGPAGTYQWEGTASFHLTGTGTATGTINGGTVGVFESYTDITGQPMVWGGYTASDGDFQSTFNAYSYERDGPAYFGHGHWSTHTLTATGVPAGSMTVTGDATAVYASGGHMGGFVEGGQSFYGEAESVVVFGSKMDSTKQGIDPATWDPTKFKGAEFTATAVGSSTVDFGGSTDAGTYYQGTETSTYQVLAKQGLGFEIGITGSSLYGTLTTTYSYTNALALEDPTTTQIIGDTSTPLIGWAGVPGYLTNP
jgi:hypothetical protein